VHNTAIAVSEAHRYFWPLAWD